MFYLLLCQLGNANLIIDGGDSLDLLFGHRLLGTYPAVELLALTVVGSVECIDEHIRLLVTEDVAADGLTEHFGVAIDVEIVVLQLEGKAHLFAELVQVVRIFFGRTGKDGTHLCGTSQEDACLQTNHFDIFIFSHILPRLEVHVVLLPLANLDGRLDEEVLHLWHQPCLALQHPLAGHEQHGIAREDGGVVVPLHVDGGLSATYAGTVHQVVVQQRVVMVSL